MGKILLLFEGAAYEPEIFESTIPLLAPDSNIADGVVCEYCTHVYKLYSQLKADDGLGLIGLLMEEIDQYPRLRDAVEDGEVTEDIFEAIYLWFDYDGHVPMPLLDDGSRVDGDMALRDMLDFFDNASENGKLLISYPMVEAIKHLSAEPASKEEIVTSKCKGPHCPNQECEHRLDREECPPMRKYYKCLVNNLFPHRTKIENISGHEWASIFKCHLKVAELLCGDDYDISSQADIFYVQHKDYISRSCPQVAVLGSFPFLYLDFLGETLLRQQLIHLANGGE